MTQHDKRPSDPSTQHEDLKPGSPPRHATEPAGDRSASDTTRTQTDPATGEDHGGAKRSEKL